MNPAHLHLLVNHFPIVGAFVSLPLLALALWRRGDRGSLLAAVTVLVVSAAGAGAAQLTGDDAEEVVEHLPGVSESLIHTHEERAEVATILAVVTGLGSLGILGFAIRSGKTPLIGTVVLTAGALATAGTMAWTGQAGGQIRHTEIRDGAPGATSEREEDERAEADEHEERGEAPARGERRE
jgi:hypothetical protein